MSFRIFILPLWPFLHLDIKVQPSMGSHAKTRWIQSPTHAYTRPVSLKTCFQASFYVSSHQFIACHNLFLYSLISQRPWYRCRLQTGLLLPGVAHDSRKSSPLLSLLCSILLSLGHDLMQQFRSKTLAIVDFFGFTFDDVIKSKIFFIFLPRLL